MSASEWDLRGRTAIVTGATTGIGKEVARRLALAGASVVLPARTPERGEAARADILREAPRATVELAKLDLASQASIRAFAADFKKTHEKLHVLVNNAGGWWPEKKLGPDGIELTFATNVLGYHLLTSLLVDTLRASAPSRIVNVASTLARGLELDDLQFEKRSYEGLAAYAQSKQANRMITWSLAKKLEKSGVTANAVHPGFVASEFNRNARGVKGVAIRIAEVLFAKTPEQGGDTPAWVAASKDVDGATAKLYASRREIRCRFRDPAACDALFERCEKMTAAR